MALGEGQNGRVCAQKESMSVSLVSPRDKTLIAHTTQHTDTYRYTNVAGAHGAHACTRLLPSRANRALTY